MVSILSNLERSKKRQVGFRSLNNLPPEYPLLFHAENIELLANGLTLEKMQLMLREIHEQLGHIAQVINVGSEGNLVYKWLLGKVLLR